MTIYAVYKEGRIVPEEPIPFAEGERLKVSTDALEILPHPIRSPKEAAFDRLLDTIARLGPKANPDFVWDRDLAYED